MALSGCGGTQMGDSLPRGAAAYGVIPVEDSGQAAEYRIGPLDTIDINVFQEPDLSAKGVQVDATGNISMPLIGRVVASGQTAPELASEIESRLRARYLVRPQITIWVTSSVTQKVVVQGEVTEPGVYQIRGSTTLLEALSLAKGETRVAALKDVVVFRTINGQRMGAMFDINQIRRGQAEDPKILGNDTVVVGFSNAKGIWRDALTAAPLLNVFRPW